MRADGAQLVVAFGFKAIVVNTDPFDDEKTGRFLHLILLLCLIMIKHEDVSFMCVLPTPPEDSLPTVRKIHYINNNIILLSFFEKHGVMSVSSVVFHSSWLIVFA